MPGTAASAQQRMQSRQSTADPMSGATAPPRYRPTAGGSGGNGGGTGDGKGSGWWSFAKGVAAIFVFTFAGLGLFVFASVMSLISLLGEVEGPVAPALPQDIVLSHAFGKPLVETRAGGGLASLVERDLTVPQLVRTLNAAARDDRVKGLIVRMEPVPMSFGHIQEVRDAVKRFREAGKFAHAFSFSMGDFAGGTGPYYLASAFDEVWLQPVGGIAINGLGMELPFAADLLERFNVEFEAVTREEYKSALAQFTESDIPPAVRENMESLINDLFEQIVEDIAADRNLTPEQLESLIDNAPLTAQTALEGGLIDRIGYRDEFLDAIEEDGEIISLTGYSSQLTESEPTSNGIALVQASGPIVQGAGGSSVFSGAMPIMRIDTTLDEIIEDDAIEAVVLRLDSPGGSPAASEFVRRAVTRVSEAGKPVVISMAQVAASGGYWIASGADAIVAQPGTFTGSIGVLAGKPNLAGVWEEWDVNWAPIYRGENADIVSTNRPFDARGLAKMNEDLDHIYDAFLERVAEARGFSTEEAREIAKGRVWSGRQAFQVGLVDELGGIETAFRLAASAAGLEVDEAVLTNYPRRQSRFDTAIEIFESLGGISEGLDILNKLSRIAEHAGVDETLEALEAAEQPVRTPLPMPLPR